MISAYVNCFKIPELRQRILFTLGIIVLCRLACTIPVPGVDPAELARMFDAMNKGAAGGLVGMFDMFSGGALQKFAVGALGIMPYISASIVIQLMTPVIPQLEKLVREGETGRQKISQYTRYLTLVICVIQGGMLAKTMLNPSMMGFAGDYKLVLSPGIPFLLITTLLLTAGTIFMMWLGEQITERGIGNGASIIITVGIVDRMPKALQDMFNNLLIGGDLAGSSNFTLVHFVGLLVMFFACCAATVLLTQGVRKIPVKYARASMGRQGAAGQTSYMPLRVNFSGVMPLIFGSAVLMFPPLLLQGLVKLFSKSAPGVSTLIMGWAPYFSHGSTTYLVLYGSTIVLFSFFWVANQFNPVQIADDLQKHGGFIPGVRPGQPTSEFLDQSMTRITFAGSLFLVGLAILPMIVTDSFKISYSISQFFGGTSLIITVGVMLDTMRQIETYLLNHHYDGFLSKGHLRSRRGGS